MNEFRILQEKLCDWHISYDDDSLKRLMLFRKIFFQWNAIHNLSAVRDERTFERYCVDCVYPLYFIRPFASMLDVGSGGGFPALVIGALCHHSRFYLVEPNKKKAAFLEIAALEMEIDCMVLKQRVQDVDGFYVDMICSRALYSLEFLLPLVERFEYATLLLYTGSNDMQNVTHNGFTHHTQGRLHYLYKERSCYDS